MRFRGAWWLIASALVVAGCGGTGPTTTTQTALAVSSVTPASGTTGVAVTSSISATFNEVMNGSTFTSSTFTLTAAGGTAVTGNVSYSAGTSTAIFTPASPLAYNTVYTATITTGVQNPAGTALAAADTWSFTTAPGSAPTVTAFTPSNGSTNVVVNTTVTAVFSEAMNTSTINSSTFTLTGPSGAVAGTIAFSATNVVSPAVDTATLTPSAPLTPSTAYTLTVTTGVLAATGGAIANVNSTSFTTAATSAPTVTAETPASGTTSVAVNSLVTATFSEAMDPATITAGSTFMVTGGGASVAGSVTPDPTNTIFTFTPTANLAYNTTYTVLITTGVLASSAPPEVPLAADFSWSFTTAAPPAAMVSAVTPLNGATGVAITSPGDDVTVAFTTAMTSSSINNATFTLTGPSGAVPGSVAYTASTMTATFTPAVTLANNATYTATIAGSVTDSLGGALGTPVTWQFTTVAATAPTVSSTTPATTPPATGVSTTAPITATFNEAMNATTLNTSTFTLMAGSSAVAGTVTYISGTDTAIFTPSSALAANTAYTATITTGAQSSTGAALAANYTWSFTTGASVSAVAVSFGTTYQTISGFGGSTAWLGTLTSAQATALFSQTNGLGLSILRMRIDPEGSATGGGAYGLPYETGEWDEELANANEAVAANSNAIVFATPWTPPATWKLAGSSSISDDGQTYDEAFASSCSPAAGYCGGYLDPNHYGDYANYLEDFVNFIDNKSTTKLYAISMQNEPEENVTYESCDWTPEQMDSFVASLSALNGGTESPTILGARLIMPEADSFQSVQAQATLNDSSAVGNVGIVAGHLYGTSLSSFYQSLAETDDKPVWMTEHFIALPTGETAPAIGDALNMAEEIHNAMTVGQYDAYVWWWIWDDDCDGVNYGLLNDGGGQAANGCYTSANPAPTYYGDAIGQWSKFIQPGYVRVSATANPVSGVYVSAYTNSSPSHYVIVAINANGAVANINFTLSDAATKISSLTPYSTTSAGGLVPQTAVTVTGGQFNYSMPAESIVTFVQ
jgi:O-glycosyl hydrolase